MRVQIQTRFDKMHTEIIIEENRRYFNFKTNRWDEVDPNAILLDDYVISLPHEVFTEVAKKIKSMDSIPDKDKSFYEGKIESLEKHLEDMRKLVFKGKKK